MLFSIDENSVGYRIRAARTGSNLTQKQLAEAVGVGSNYIATVERGSKTASEDLIKRIASVTGTTPEWLMGISQNQTPYPEQNKEYKQVKDNTATVPYLIEIIQTACQEKTWVDKIRVPEKLTSFPKTDWLPEYWFYVDDDETESQISYWAFDLSLCIYKRPDIFSKDGSMSPKIAFFNFLGSMTFSNPLIRGKTKYTFVVPTEEIFNTLLKKPTIPLGNLSILQIDVPNKKVVQEQYLCVQNDKQKYLTETLHF